MNLKQAFSLVALFVGVSLLSDPQPVLALPEYAAFSGSNCMACHVGPVGGFGRRAQNLDSPGAITDKFHMSGDFQFMVLYDKREPDDNRLVFFPMEASLHFDINLYPTLTAVGTMDFGNLREVYGMVHNENRTAYGRAGFSL